MGDRHRGVGRLQHQGHGLAHQDAAADHHGPFPGGVNAVGAEQRHHPSRRAAAWPRLTFQQPPHVEGVEPIGILLRVDRLKQRPLIQSSRQRQLQQDPIHPGIAIQRPYRPENILGRGVGWQVIAEAGNADASASLFLVGHIHRTGGVIANPKHRQTWRTSGFSAKRLDDRLKTCFHVFRQRLSVQPQGHPQCLPSASSMPAWGS